MPIHNPNSIAEAFSDVEIVLWDSLQVANVSLLTFALALNKEKCNPIEYSFSLLIPSAFPPFPSHYPDLIFRLLI
jgi:hypothetical protein